MNITSWKILLMTQREYVLEKTGFKLDMVIDLENLSLVPSSLQHEIKDGDGGHKVRLQDTIEDEKIPVRDILRALP